MTDPTARLHDGHHIPRIGLGTHRLSGEAGTSAMEHALGVGYRLLDTAVNYGNEVEVGEALRRSGLPRDEVFVTTKVPGRHHAHADAVASVEGSLERLGLDRLDLVLVHWPNPSVDRYVEAWRALVDLRERGLTRSIGVSNFTEAHLRRIVDETGVVPVVNQVELHPRFPQEQMRAVHDELDIRTQSWSPLGKHRAAYDDPAVAGPARTHGVTPAQVILRWHLQVGALPIPKSATPERQRSNLDVLDLELSDAEVAAITALGRPEGRLWGGDPDTHEEM